MSVLKENATIKENYKNKTDGLYLLNQIQDNSIKVCLFDPQYRGVLDKLKYGSEEKTKRYSKSNFTPNERRNDY